MLERSTITNAQTTQIYNAWLASSSYRKADVTYAYAFQDFNTANLKATRV